MVGFARDLAFGESHYRHHSIGNLCPAKSWYVSSAANTVLGSPLVFSSDNELLRFILLLISSALVQLHDTHLTGNLDPILCDRDHENATITATLERVVVDCATTIPEIQCRCCTCCPHNWFINEVNRRNHTC